LKNQLAKNYAKILEALKQAESKQKQATQHSKIKLTPPHKRNQQPQFFKTDHSEKN